MQALGLTGRYQSMVEIDICEPCTLIWFDDNESARLAGPAIVDIVRLIHTAVQQRQRMPPMPARLPCPICAKPLQYVKKLGRHGRTALLACPDKHGAYQSFLLFLAEKGYFRPYTWADIQPLIEAGKTLTCNQCGGALEARPQEACPYCDTPVGVIDPTRLADAIKAENLADRLPPVPAATLHQSTCPACGGAVDLTQHVNCPHCHGVLSPPKTLDALMASVAAAKQPLEETAPQPVPAPPVPDPDRVEADRRAPDVSNGCVLGCLGVIGAVVLLFVLIGAVQTMRSEYARKKEIEKIQSERREAMARIPRAPPGIVPEFLEAHEQGRCLVVKSRSDLSLSVFVSRVQGHDDSWSRCWTSTTGPDLRSNTAYLTHAGSEATFCPERCDLANVERDGLYEFVVMDQLTGRELFKSDSAFYH